MSRSYLDFEVLVHGEAGGDSQVTVKSPAGGGDTEVRFPLEDPDFQARLESVGHSRGSTLSVETSGSEAPPERREESDAVDVGRALFETLMREKLRRLYTDSRVMADTDGKGLRLRLMVQAPHLATLPWELLYDPEAGDGEGAHLVLDAKTPVVRHLLVAHPAKKLDMPRPLRILALTASPKDRVELNVRKERRLMESALAHLFERGEVEVHFVRGKDPEDDRVRTLDDLRREIVQSSEPWHVFHFIGHGGFDRNAGEGFIELCDDDGRSVPVSATELGEQLKREPNLRLAVLNCCKGAQSSGQDLFSSTGATLVKAGIPAVVSMKSAISDEAAIEFSRSFYMAFAAGLGVDEAMAEARFDIRRACPGRSEWATPVLYLCLEDGQLFDVKDEKYICASEGYERRGSDVLDRSTHHVDVGSYWPFRVTVTTSRKERPEAESDLLAKVRDAWIEGRLKALAGREVGQAPELELLGRSLDAPHPGLLQAFDAAGGSLLVLGDPGSGKGTQILKLTQDLLDRAEEDVGRPIPVVVPLSDRAAEHADFRHFLLDELAGQYQVPRALGRRWLRQRLLLPLLDGLDTVSEGRRGAVVEALNAFLRDAPGMVVGCRRGEYMALPTKLELDCAVVVKPLGDDQVQAELEGGEDPALWQELEKDSALRLAARSPLMLSFIVRMARRLGVERLGSRRFDSVPERRRHVLETFVEDAFEREEPKDTRTFSRQEVLTYLSWLAREMRLKGQSLFLVERLQPSWLPTVWQRSAVVFLSSALVGLAAGFAMDLAWWMSFRADPPVPVCLPDLEPPEHVAISWYFWLLVPVVWALLAHGTDVLRRRWPRPGESLLGDLRSHVEGTAIYLALWLTSWIGAWALFAPDEGLVAWLHQPGVGGVAFAVIYQIRVGSKATTDRIEPVEALRWRWPSAWTGAMTGAVAGVLVWVVYCFTSDPRLSPPGFASEHWRFYVPVALATGFALGGLRSRRRRGSTVPNEGIRLSLRNGWIAVAVVGPIFAVTCFLTLRYIRGQEAFPAVNGDLWAQVEIAAVSLVAASLVAFLWFGGLDFLRHWLLRFCLAANGPLHVVDLLEQATRLGFMDRVGGGYVFIHRFVQDYFDQLAEKEPASPAIPDTATEDSAVQQPSEGDGAPEEKQEKIMEPPNDDSSKKALPNPEQLLFARFFTLLFLDAGALDEFEKNPDQAMKGAGLTTEQIELVQNAVQGEGFRALLRYFKKVDDRGPGEDLVGPPPGG